MSRGAALTRCPYPIHGETVLSSTQLPRGPMRLSVVPPLAVALLVTPLAAQQPTAPAQQPAAPPLEVGAVAPDFTLPGATRDGVLDTPIKLSDFKGKTVVLAFFFRARTRG